ncbi:MAG: pyridoxamine 5'-phosphate oxidase family protein [Mycobacterium sp.]
MRGRAYDGGLGLARLAAGTQILDSTTAMRLLASVDYGRIVFTFNALPAIRPVNHLVDERRIVIRTRLTASITAPLQSGDGVVVTYEADNLDSRTRAGWSVVATGRVYTVTDPHEVSRYEQLLQPWVNHADTVVAIEPEMITGLRILPPG